METRTPSSVVHELRAQDFVGASDRSSDDTGFHEVELASAPAALQGYCRKDTDPIRYSHKIGQVRLSIQPGEVTGVVRQRHKVAPVELLCHRPLATGSPHEGYKRSSVQLQGRQSRQSHFPHSMAFFRSSPWDVPPSPAITRPRALETISAAPTDPPPHRRSCSAGEPVSCSRVPCCSRRSPKSDCPATRWPTCPACPDGG